MEVKKPKYRVVDKYVNNLVINKYTIENIEEGNMLTITKEDLIKLTLSNKVADANVVVDTVNNSYILILNNDIPIHDNNRFYIVCRIINNNKCIGYKVKDNDNKNYRISIAKAWELACNNSINNLEAKIIANKKVLRLKDGSSLSELPKMTDV